MPGYVYFIRVGDLYRVGKTDNLDRKIKKLNPDELLTSIMTKEPETLEARLLRKYKSQNHYFIYNKSINETLSRTLITSITTLIALIIIYFFGGAVLSDFSLAMIWGVVIGTYSSIFIAVSFLTYFKIYKGDKKDTSEPIPEYER